MAEANKTYLSEQGLAKAKEIIARYPAGRQKSALLPILHLVQDENQNSLTTESMNYVADLLQIKPVEVYEVATFYTMYNLKPVGKHVLEFCRTGPCCLVGAEDIIAYTENKLGIKDGETTPDGEFSIKCMECLGACGYGPMMQVGEYYYEHLTTDRIDHLLSEFKKGNRPVEESKLKF
ncbi:MAG TPA: NAD(P)H-dependent oxidoreductase subunit E [Luteibaculaceae bacterium]|nr:NAD(P)H-dependent oxidoreductase subunit E [Luteibaculaceae bacterium]